MSIASPTGLGQHIASMSSSKQAKPLGEVCQILHDTVCHGAAIGADPHCDGKDHRKTQLPTARKFLAAETDREAVGVIHDTRCDGWLDPNCQCFREDHISDMFAADGVQKLLDFRPIDSDLWQCAYCCVPLDLTGWPRDELDADGTAVCAQCVGDFE